MASEIAINNPNEWFPSNEEVANLANQPHDYVHWDPETQILYRRLTKSPGGLLDLEILEWDPGILYTLTPDCDDDWVKAPGVTHLEQVILVWHPASGGALLLPYTYVLQAVRDHYQRQPSDVISAAMIPMTIRAHLLEQLILTAN